MAEIPGQRIHKRILVVPQQGDRPVDPVDARRRGDFTLVEVRLFLAVQYAQHRCSHLLGVTRGRWNSSIVRKQAV
jgi:hypothetical protein